MTISGFAAYVKQLWKNKPDTSTPLSAERLAHIEDGIKGNSTAIEKIAAAVVNQIVNDPDKIASMAALFSVQTACNANYEQLNSDLGTKLVGSDGDGLRALQSVSDPYRTRLQIMDGKNYAEIFRSADSGRTWTSLGILAAKDDTAKIFEFQVELNIDIDIDGEMDIDVPIPGTYSLHILMAAIPQCGSRGIVLCWNRQQVSNGKISFHAMNVRGARYTGGIYPSICCIGK